MAPRLRLVATWFCIGVLAAATLCFGIWVADTWGDFWLSAGVKGTP